MTVAPAIASNASRMPIVSRRCLDHGSRRAPRAAPSAQVGAARTIDAGAYG